VQKAQVRSDKEAFAYLHRTIPSSPLISLVHYYHRKSHGKIGFAEMARAISSKWKMITPENKAYYDELAAQDKVRYKSQMAAWNEQRSLRAQLAPEELTEATPTASPSSSGDVDCHPKDADDFERLADLVSFEDGYDEAGAIMPEPYMMDPVPFNQSYMGYDSALTNRFTLQQLAHNLGREGQDFLIAAFRKY
jgi:hypothetical protein